MLKVQRIEFIFAWLQDDDSVPLGLLWAEENFIWKVLFGDLRQNAKTQIILLDFNVFVWSVHGSSSNKEVKVFVSCILY